MQQAHLPGGSHVLFLPDSQQTGPWLKPNSRAKPSQVKKEQWPWNLIDQSPGIPCPQLCGPGKISLGLSFTMCKMGILLVSYS